MPVAALRITFILGLPLLLLACSGPGATRHESVRSAFASDPEGASVFIDGGFVGQTPTSFFLPDKDIVDVRVQHPGYLPMEEELHRAKVPEEAGEGVGWESSYYYPLTPKR
jgi:PEGA domain-containing protein